MSPEEEPPATPPATVVNQTVPPSNAPAPVVAAPASGLSAFFSAATGISRALAADDLGQFNQQVAKLSSGLASWQKDLAGTPLGKTMLKRVESLTQTAPAKNLADARKRFLPFSTALVDFAKQQRKLNPTSADLKIFHCPMAPKPGLWVQAGGPLRNPFYGAEMLTCGEEVAE
jgi:Cu(I)/Ag(I) efflux system membrane fusion protein